MKNSLIIYIIIFISSIACADTVLFEENFETTTNLVSSGKWISATPSSSTGLNTSCEGSKNWSPMFASASTAQTINIYIPSNGVATLTFEFKYSKSWGTMPTVKISVDGGTYNLVKTLSFQTNCLAVSIDLSAYVGSNISLEFKSTDTGGIFQVDNILINHTLSSCTEVYFEDDFGTTYEAGYLTNNNWCASDWDYNSSQNACDGYSWRGEGNSFNIRTNAFTLGTTGDIILSFDYKYDDSNNALAPTVDIKTGGGCSGGYNQLLQLEEHLTCHTASISIPSAYWGETVHLKFKTYNSGATFILDNIKVQKCGETLPVIISNFEGVSENEKSILNWTTLSEINSDIFEIQKSTNGIEFINIGEVKANGYSNRVIKYKFTDTQTNQVLNYYRLKQIDYDGSFEYSKTIAIKPNNNPKPIIYTTQNKEAIVKFSKPYTGTIKIFDLTGKIISKKELTSSYKIIFQGLKQGLYLIQIESNKESYSKQKIFIN